MGDKRGHCSASHFLYVSGNLLSGGFSEGQFAVGSGLVWVLEDVLDDFCLALDGLPVSDIGEVVDDEIKVHEVACDPCACWVVVECFFF